MANMTFRLFPVREVETGPVDYGFGWRNLSGNGTLWVHNPITNAINPNQSYTTPHVSSEGWLFDFKLTLSEVSGTFVTCKLSDKAEYPFAYTFTPEVSSGTIPWEDGTGLVKSLAISSTTNKEATGQILLDSHVVYEMLQKSSYLDNVLNLPLIKFKITTEWGTSTEESLTAESECILEDFSLSTDDDTFGVMNLTVAYDFREVPSIGTSHNLAYTYTDVSNGLSSTIFNPDTTSFKYELLKGYQENNNVKADIKITSPFKLKNTMSVGHSIFIYFYPKPGVTPLYGKISKISSNTDFVVSFDTPINKFNYDDIHVPIWSNKYLIYDTSNVSQQYSFRMINSFDGSATIQQSKTSLKAVEFIESDENQIAFQRGGRVWCKEFIENNNSENVEFHKSAKISPNLITSLNGTGYDPEEGSQDIYITIDNDTNTAKSQMPAPATSIAFSYNLVKGLKVTLPTPEKMGDAPVFYCSGLPYDYSYVIQGKTPELEFIFYQSGVKKLTMSTNDNLGGCTAGLLNETGDYTVDVNLVYPQYGRNPSGVYWDLTIYPQIEVQIWENGQAQGLSPFSKYGTVLSKDYYIQSKEFKE